MVQYDNFEFRRAPVGSAEHCATVSQKCVLQAAKTITAICQHTNPQIGMQLLRICAGFYTHSSTAQGSSPPTNLRNPVRRFGLLVRKVFVDPTYVHPNDEQWDQTTKGFDTGGLGLR